MIFYKTDEEIEKIRTSCLLVSKTLGHVASLIAPGVTGKHLDQEAEQFIRDHSAVPGFKGYNDFPATLCISINDGVVHGIPTDIPFENGDIVSIDCGAILDEFYGDSAYTFPLGDIEPDVFDLLSTTNQSLYKGIAMAKPGNRLEDIGYTIQQYAEKEKKYGIVRELVGHGIGKNLHEAPEVPNYGKRGRGVLLKNGLVIAIEPMINLGTRKVKQSPDNWTIITQDGKPSAHYEHTVAVRKNGPDILSDHSFIEESLKKNDAIVQIPLKS